MGRDRTGSHGNVAVVGWAGAGKTTVAGTFARAVAAHGTTVLAVKSNTLEIKRAYV